MPPDAAKRVWDAAEACRRIESFLQGITQKEFSSSELIRAAVERQLEIIGEA